MNMRIIILIVALATFPAFTTCADVLSLELNSETPRVPLGIPLELSVTMKGNGRFMLPTKFNAVCDDHMYFIIKDSSSNMVPFSFGAPCGVSEQTTSYSEHFYENSVTATATIFLSEGRYSIHASYNLSTNAYHNSNDPNTSGEIASDQRLVEVYFPSVQEDIRTLLEFIPPKGASVKDYALLLEGHQQEILKYHPKSIYAAWIIYRRLGRPEDIDPLKLKDFMKNGSYPLHNSVPDANSPTGWKELPDGKLMAEWLLEQANLILEEHPDFPYKDRLFLIMGVQNVVLGKKEEGSKHLLRISRNQNTVEGRWANDFLKVINNQ